MDVIKIASLLTEDISTNRGFKPVSQIIYEHILEEDKDLIQVLAQRFPGFEKTLKRAGVDISSLSYVASGDKGGGFTDGQLFVKITEDSKEAMAAANIVGIDVDGFNKIYYVGKFSDEVAYQREGDEEPIDTQYYAIVQDLVEGVPSVQQKKAANAVGKFLNDYGARLPWPFDPDKAAKLVKNHYYVKKREIIGGPMIDDTIRDLLSSVNRLYSKYGVKYLDVKDDNIGVNTDGELVMFDLGVSESPRKRIDVIR